jgi:hypothetical protein
MKALAVVGRAVAREKGYYPTPAGIPVSVWPGETFDVVEGHPVADWADTTDEGASDVAPPRPPRSPPLDPPPDEDTWNRRPPRSPPLDPPPDDDPEDPPPEDEPVKRAPGPVRNPRQKKGAAAAPADVDDIA